MTCSNIKTAELAQEKSPDLFPHEKVGSTKLATQVCHFSADWLLKTQFIGKWNSDYINTSTYLRGRIYCQFKYQDRLMILGTLWASLSKHSLIPRPKYGSGNETRASNAELVACICNPVI